MGGRQVGVNLLALWRAHGVDTAMRTAWAAGVVLGGVSAGSLCCHAGGTTDSYGPELMPMTAGLHLLESSNCPHYDSEPGAARHTSRSSPHGGPGWLGER